MPKRPSQEVIDQAVKSLETMLCLAVLGEIDLRFADESAFGLTPNVPYGWIRIGEQYDIVSSKGGRLNVFGLLNYRGQLTSYTTTGRVDSGQVIEWMDDFVSGAREKTVVVLDNAPWHTSKEVGAKIREWKKAGVDLFFLPPYCPHLNIIETLWRKMKHEWLRPQDFNDKAALHARVKEILENYGSGKFDIEFSKLEMFV